MKHLITYIVFFCFSVFAFCQAPEYTFEDCIQKAYENNIQIKQAEIQQQIAEINESQSRYSLLPSLNGGANASNSVGRSIDPFSNEFTEDNVFSTNYSLNSNLQLFSALSKWNTIKQSQINSRKAQEDLSSTKNDISLLVASSFLQVLLNQDNLNSAKDRVENAEKQLENTRKLVESGRLPINNLLDMEAQLATENLNYLNAEKQLQNSKLSLMQSIGEFDLSDIKIVAPELVLPTFDSSATLQKIYEKASEDFSKIESARYNVESNEVGLRISKASYYPSLNFSATIFTGTSSARKQYEYDYSNAQVVPIGFLTSDASQTVSTVQVSPIATNYPYTDQIRDNFRQQFSFNLSIPIFNNFTFRTNVARAKLQIESAKLNLETVTNQLKKDVQNAFYDVRSASANLKSARKKFEATKKVMENSKLRYENGLMSSVDYLNAINNHSQSENQLRQAKYNLIFNAKILDFYLGNEIKL